MPLVYGERRQRQRCVPTRFARQEPLNPRSCGLAVKTRRVRLMRIICFAVIYFRAMRNTAQILVDRLGPLVEPLHEAFELARHRLDNDYRGLCGDDQGWLRTHALRGLVYRGLSNAPLPERWRLTGNHRQNGAINMAFGSGEIALRFFHSISGATPIAGTNNARRAYYTQQALTELSDPNHFPTQRLLLLWEELDRVGEFLLNVVRPLDPGTIGEHVKHDLRIPMPRIRTAFESLVFDTADDDEVLEFDIDQRELGNATDGD